jgi:hypothetical protein
MRNLISLKLEVLDIHRKGIFDMDALAFCCDNCGRTIINSATVKDIDTGKVYVIGLDCKKTLVDKPLFDKVMESEPLEYVGKHKVKELKRELNDVQKVMMYLDNSDRYEVVVDGYNSQYLTVYDNHKLDSFGNAGASVFSEAVGYLFRIGLKNVLLAAQSKGIITKR